MITKNDILLLLTNLQASGLDTSNEMAEVLQSDNIPLTVIKLINDNRQLDVSSFYEKLRKSYNSKKSKLYMNIMKADENVLNDPKTVVTTLSALLNQILQYEAEDRVMFYKHARCDEIITVLSIYFTNFNLEPALKLLKLFKADIKCIEMVK